MSALAFQPYRTTGVLLPKLRALLPWCATAPLAELAEEIDNLLDEMGEIDGVYAATRPVIGFFSCVEKLADMEFAARRDCGAEPCYDQYASIDYVHGGYNERGDGAAWDRWKERCDAAQDRAGREFRSVMAAMLRDVERVMVAEAAGTVGVRIAA